MKANIGPQQNNDDSTVFFISTEVLHKNTLLILILIKCLWIKSELENGTYTVQVLQFILIKMGYSHWFSKWRRLQVNCACILFWIVSLEGETTHFKSIDKVHS